MKEQDIAILSSIGVNAEFLNNVEQACEKAANNIVQRVQELGSTPIGSAQGFFAENWHTETFNVDAVLNRMDGVVAEIKKTKGMPWLSKEPDLLIKDLKNHDKIIEEIGSKSYKNGKDSVDAQKGYGDQTRLIPTDQMEDAKKYIDHQVIKGVSTGRDNRVANAQELENIRDKLTDRIKYGNAESQPLGRKESEAKLKETLREGKIEIQPQIDATHIIEESLRSGAVAAGITISMFVVPRIYNVIVQRCRNGEWPSNAVQSIFNGIGSKTIEAGLRGCIATSITMSAKAGLLGEVARSLDPTLIGTLTFITIEGAKDFTKLRKGELTGDLFTDSMLRKSVSATAGAYGAFLGQLVIPVPVVGAMAGAMLGSIIANHGYQFLDTMSEAYFRTAEFEQMKKINTCIAIEWNAIISDYEQWVENGFHYKVEKQKLEAQISVQDAIIKDFDRRLLQDLEDADE